MKDSWTAILTTSHSPDVKTRSPLERVGMPCRQSNDHHRHRDGNE